mmetsp:Transcript_20140/g.49405  ORF Transcript_20140/g.49405 Transcript_20140/m.49405 type:complete len:100 (+) Transcript_20140:152-451(+)
MAHFFTMYMIPNNHNKRDVVGLHDAADDVVGSPAGAIGEGTVGKVEGASVGESLTTIELQGGILSTHVSPVSQLHRIDDSSSVLLLLDRCTLVNFAPPS